MGYPPALNDAYYNEDVTPLQSRTWRSHFGVCPRASLNMWRLLLTHFEHEHARGLDLSAFFMTLCFLKSYPSVEMMASRVQKDPKTVRKWLWWYIRKMASLHPILVSNSGSVVRQSHLLNLILV